MKRRHYDWKSIMDIRLERKANGLMDYALYALSCATVALILWCAIFDAPHAIVR